LVRVQRYERRGGGKKGKEKKGKKRPFFSKNKKGGGGITGVFYRFAKKAGTPAGKRKGRTKGAHGGGKKPLKVGPFAPFWVLGDRRLFSKKEEKGRKKGEIKKKHQPGARNCLEQKEITGEGVKKKRKGKKEKKEGKSFFGKNEKRFAWEKAKENRGLLKGGKRGK